MMRLISPLVSDMRSLYVGFGLRRNFDCWLAPGLDIELTAVATMFTAAVDLTRLAVQKLGRGCSLYSMSSSVEYIAFHERLSLSRRVL